MAGSTAGVWLITGAQASGKSTVAELLAREFEPSAHVRGGQFYRWAVRGWVHFDDPERQSDARRLLDLRYRLSSSVADQYAAEGFTTFVQDNIYGADVERWLGSIAARPLHLVVLRPSLAAVQAREAARQSATGRVAYRGGFTPAENDAHLATTPRDLGLWLDTSSQTPEATAHEILARATEAQVE